ncbi:unnamed protein product [Adineta steineri]|uniref:Uncharacterized protein n=1 Tax=Adineta steineri TaxID=433720 RepID=A0A819NS63_9BILA|nr:unnamed protein product [Adineta steineri]CAF4001040.1 unnamed protein product [Adineta steineri]
MYVINSLDLSFINKIYNYFPNEMYVIVNSLSSSLLKESMKFLTSHGHFIELGKCDVFSKSSITMFDFQENCNLHIIDLALLTYNEQETFNEILHDMKYGTEQGIFKSIELTLIHSPINIMDIFTCRSRDLPMDKSIIQITNYNQSLTIQNSAKKEFFLLMVGWPDVRLNVTPQ